MSINPIIHENGQPVTSLYNKSVVIGAAGFTALHYLGNRYLWRWYTDGQLLTAHGLILFNNVITERLVSNIVPGADKPTVVAVDRNGRKISVAVMKVVGVAPEQAVGLKPLMFDTGLKHMITQTPILAQVRMRDNYGEAVPVYVRGEYEAAQVYSAEGGALALVASGEEEVLALDENGGRLLVSCQPIKVPLFSVNGYSDATKVPVVEAVMQRPSSMTTQLVKFVLGFTPMVALPWFGQPRIGFWGCLIGFPFHTFATAMPLAIGAGVASVVGVFAAVWTGAIKRPRPTGHYETMGLTPDASPEEIKAAYRDLSRLYHSDRLGANIRNKKLPEGTTVEEVDAKFKAIAAANEVLSDPEKRTKYDRLGLDNESQLSDWRTIICVLVFAATDAVFNKKEQPAEQPES